MNGKDEHYHIGKTKSCESQNIRLIHIWDYQWYTQQDLVKSMLLHTLGKSNQIFARRCKVEPISHKVASGFLMENHIQGSCLASVRLGLFYDGSLVMCMTLGKSRFNRKFQWEIYRMAAVKGHTIVGGASKLFSFFVNQHDPINVVSYSDKSLGTGKVYSKMGFAYSGTSAPGYKYTRNFSVFYHRSKFQKSKLKNLLGSYNPDLTEWENMQLNKYDRIWDCGNDIWEWKK